MNRLISKIFNTINEHLCVFGAINLSKLMVIFVLVGIFCSSVAIAMVIAILKCCADSLVDDRDNHDQLGKINTYRSRYANTYRRNTYDTDDLTEVWTTNDNNGSETQWNDTNVEVGCNGGDSKLEDEYDPKIVVNDSNHKPDNDPKFEGGDSTSGGENKTISGAGDDAKLEGSGHIHDTAFNGGSHSLFGQSERNPTFETGNHPISGAEIHSAFGGHDSSHVGGYNSSHGGGHESSFGGGYDTGYDYGGSSYGGGD